MMIRNLMIGLPVMLLCMVLQVAVAFWGVRYFVQQTSGTGRQGSSSGSARCWS